MWRHDFFFLWGVFCVHVLDVWVGAGRNSLDAEMGLSFSYLRHRGACVRLLRLDVAPTRRSSVRFLESGVPGRPQQYRGTCCLRRRISSPVRSPGWAALRVQMSVVRRHLHQNEKLIRLDSPRRGGRERLFKALAGVAKVGWRLSAKSLGT